MRGVILGLVLAALSLPALAQVVKKGRSDLDKLVMTKRELRLSQTLTDSESIKERQLEYRTEMSSFRSEYGPSWRFLIDERTGRVNLLEGGAIPFIPGHANKLQWQDFGTDCHSPSCIPPAKMESLAREFLVHNRGALQINPEELVLDLVGSMPVGNSVYFMRFQWVHGEVPVEGGSVFLAINNGNLIQVGVTNIGNINLDPKPTVSLERALQVLKSYVGGMDERDEVVNKGSLAIIPITPKEVDPDTVLVPFGKMIDYVLVYKLAFRRPGVMGTWEALVDAHTGELIRFRDSNDYGQIRGGVYKTDKPQTEVTMPFPKADYGPGTYADDSGNFPGNVGTSTMTGLNAGGAGVSGGVKITDNCGAISLSANAVGLIDFGNQSGVGTDCTTPGIDGAGNTHAARTQYWNVTEIKMKGITYLPTNTWLQGQLLDLVNLNQTCNAYWDGAKLNFFKSGGGCNNTGELPGVSLHEWGHGMDANDGSGTPGTDDNVPIESRADWTALLQTHQSCTGAGFFSSNCGGYGNPCTSCTGIRDADYAQHTHPTPWTPQNNGQANPGYSCSPGGYNGPCGWEDHCESGIPTQALWDFVNRDLVGAPTNLDLVTAWQLEDRLFYTGMPQSTNMYTCTGTTTKTSNGCGAGSLYTVMRAIDDDGDGTANGTPHAAAIFAALNRHGIACGAAGDPTNQNQTSCPSLTTPTLTGTANNSQVTLNWTTGGVNATRYFVLRNETGCGAGYTRIATVAAPTLTYTDTSVVHGLTYYYRIQAATANDSCVSSLSNCATVAASLAADKDFYVRDWTDNPGSHDNGEEPSTNYLANWAYSSDVWNRGSNTPGAPNASDWYPTDDMYAGAGALGDNYGFVRVSRNASGSTAAVTAEFLVSPFGAGSNFASVGTTTLNFGTTDQELTQGSYWHQDATASTHACIAVEISTPDDPYLSPDLANNSPGQPGGQALILLDNNKAQRNLNVSHNVAHFTGLMYGLIHNPALYRRDMVLRYESPAADKLSGAQIEVVGGRTVEFRSSGTITLEGMQPGENRWIAIRYQVPSGDPVPIHFLEMANGSSVNGFTVMAQPVSLNVAIRENLRNHVQVFNRLAAAFGAKSENVKAQAAVFGAKAGNDEAQAAETLRRQNGITPAQYGGFLEQHAKAMGSILEALVAKDGTGDAFGALKTLKDLGDAVGKKQAEQSASEHAMLLNRLDSLATKLQKAQGDPADILQMARWQEALYRMRPDLHRLDCSERVVKDSQEFIKTYDRRKEQSYPALLHALSPCFHQTAKALEKDQQKLENAAAAMERTGVSLAALEKAHRGFLLALQDAVGGVQN